jgi:hypothetical protein
MDRRAFVLLIPGLAMLGCASSSTEKPAAAGPVFSDKERALITDYFGADRARRPVQAKPAQRAKPGDRMDSGQRPTPLPSALNDRLSYLPSPYTRLMLGADVILVDRNTHAILDVVPQEAY